MERVDEIGFGGYRLIQDSESFCYGVDAVLLADFCEAGHQDTVLDLCCGNGAVSLIVYAKYAPKSIVGIELQKDAVELAERSAELNGLSDKLRFICGDALNADKMLKGGTFDLVICNPPYFEKGRGVECGDSPRQLARHESCAGAEDFFRAAAFALRTGGRFCVIHRPERLADLICAGRANKLEPKRLRMIVPHSGDSPNLVLIQFVKNGGKGLAVLPDLAVIKKDGGFTADLDMIYGRVRI